MKVKTFSDLTKAALGLKDVLGVLVLEDPGILLAMGLRYVFVEADINSAAAPATQAPWSGHYT